MSMQMTQQASFFPADRSVYVQFEQSIVSCTQSHILMPFYVPGQYHSMISTTFRIVDNRV